MEPQVIDTLRKQLGEAKVLTDDEALEQRCHDYWVLSHLRDWRGELWGKYGWADRPPRGATLEEMQAIPLREPGSTASVKRRSTAWLPYIRLNARSAFSASSAS